MSNKRRMIKQGILIGVLTLICIMWIVPLIFLLGISFRTNESLQTNTFMFFPVGDAFTIDNYKIILSNSSSTPILTWLVNSLIVSSATAIITVIICSLSAFAFARMKFKLKPLLFGLLLITMMVPGVITIIPNFLTVSGMGMADSLWALIIPCVGGVANVYLIRQFFYSIPKELDESASIDGASTFKLFYRIILPQMVPILVVVGINSFLGSWNDLLWPRIINTQSIWNTMTSGLSNITSAYDRQYGVIAAATVFSALPVLILFIIAQKYIIKGISATSGMKE
ncbi:MAG: carbohydrate ABC transporter permease [Bacilli bacterium]|nr:carbohydrate ABC transporter permease [Bacilli bacterium]